MPIVSLGVVRCREDARGQTDDSIFVYFRQVANDFFAMQSVNLRDSTHGSSVVFSMIIGLWYYRVSGRGCLFARMNPRFTFTPRQLD